MPDPRTPGGYLTADQHRRFTMIRRELPWSLSYPGIPPTVRSVDGVLLWLDGYVRHAQRQVDKLGRVDASRARASVVLRGLRDSVANMVETIGQLDADLDAGRLLPLAVAEIAEPTPSAQVVHDLLSLVSEEFPVPMPTVDQVEAWTDEERRDVAAWAGAVHLSASDNDDVEIPRRPEILSSPRRPDDEPPW